VIAAVIAGFAILGLMFVVALAWLAFARAVCG
jgi:hypothetical protein